MELSVFEGCKREELSMIEVAHALLEQKDKVMEFAELVNEIQDYLKKSDIEVRKQLSQFYTDLNIDGGFIFLGKNRVGLRSWYAIGKIDEELTDLDDNEKGLVHKKKKRINAFVSGDDVIDWDNDDSEDENFSNDLDDDLSIDDDDEDDEEDEDTAYDSNLSEVKLDEKK
ncbi:MAG: DNA-directed RNA polymerase subunit delta [Streptococcaceae bacterium]|nr:DNA-directed RNA polymerase subunit delta [Streptococcaceae bacterium]